MPTEYPTLMNCPWRPASVSGHYVRVKRIVMWGYTRQGLLPSRQSRAYRHPQSARELLSPSLYALTS